MDKKYYIKAAILNPDGSTTEKVLYALDKDRYGQSDAERLLDNVMMTESMFGTIIEAWITDDKDEPQSKSSGRVCLEF
jgi:hypothetical protein